MYQSVTERISGQLSERLASDDVASLVVPGGTTPAPVFDLLSRQELPWNDISILPSDERWIDVSNPQSNQNLIEHKLLVNHAASARFIGLKNSAVTAAEGESLVEQNLANVNQPFTVTLLGMGNDGHFASLFPGIPVIEQALDLEQDKNCLAINAEGCEVAGEYTERMSLTLAALVNSSLIIILITGEQKLDVVRSAAECTDQIDKPVSALLAQSKTPVEIYWAE